jgi:hypothetical protein
MKNLSGLIVAMFMLTGCSDGMLSELSREIGDPFAENPAVSFFRREGQIDITWSEDMRADGYILQRALDHLTPAYSVVYKGQGTSFTETNAPAHERYLYRLIKTRGHKAFEPSKEVLGVGGNFMIDEHEPNDGVNTATLLNREITSNLYFYRAYGGQTAEDEDWYYLEIEPRTKVFIKVYQQGLSDVEIASDLFITQLGQTNLVITNAKDMTVTNTAYEKKNFYFKIHAHKENLVSGYYQIGGSVIVYTITPFRRDLIGEF